MTLAQALSCRFGYDPKKYVSGLINLLRPPDFSDESWSILAKVRRRTMTSPERICALVESVRFIVRQNIPGSIVECGVWKGGSMMAAALALENLKDTDRDLHLFDTFEGMPRPTDDDVDLKGRLAARFFQKFRLAPDSSNFCRATIEEVRQAMDSTDYPQSRVHFIKGRVEETIPKFAPESIALLRLDTDWYESTKHELIHLFPRLSRRGIVIIDDYGHWRGARKAVDEYFAETGHPVFLSRVDYTARVAVKLD